MPVPDVVMLIAGVVAAAVGGDLFVRGAVGISAWARVPAGVIGTTVAAFATSSPEMSVAIQAASAGQPAVALGDALGSNVVNLTLVLGISLTLGTLTVQRGETRRELVVAALAPLLTVAVLIDGRMVRAEAALLLASFAVWLVAVTRHALRLRSTVVDAVSPPRRGDAVTATAVGLIVLVLAGRFIVSAAKGIGDSVGLDPFVVGATLVAVGTSTPELATALVSRRRGHDEIGVGTVLGSNVFNNLWIVGLAGVVEPIEVAADEVLLAVVAGLVALALVVPDRSGRLGRRRGMALLGIFVVYSLATVAFATGRGSSG